VALAADDDVVQELHAEQVSGAAGLPGEANVLRRRRWVARGVVVHEDDRRRAAGDRPAEAVRQADRRGVQPALVDELRADDMVLRVEQDDAQLLLRQVGELRAEVPGDVGRAAQHLVAGPDPQAAHLVAVDELGQEPQVLAHEVQQLGRVGRQEADLLRVGGAGHAARSALAGPTSQATGAW